jgi:hypothetical protein
MSEVAAIGRQVLVDGRPTRAMARVRGHEPIVVEDLDDGRRTREGGRVSTTNTTKTAQTTSNATAPSAPGATAR